MAEYTSLISEKSCRACLTYFSCSSSKYKLISIYDKVSNTTEKDFLVCDALERINVHIDEKDVLPKFICHSCLKSLKVAYNFQELCISSKNKYINNINNLLNNDGSEFETLRTNLVKNNSYNKNKLKSAPENEGMYEEPTTIINIKTESDMAERNIENPSEVLSKYSVKLLHEVIEDLECSDGETNVSEDKQDDADYNPLQDDLDFRATTSTYIDKIQSYESGIENDKKLEVIDRIKLSKSKSRETENDKNIEFNKITPRRQTQNIRLPLQGILSYSCDNFKIQGLITKCKNCCKYIFTSRIKVHKISCSRMLYNSGIEHLPIEDDPNKYTCFYCSENLESIDLIEDHIITKHEKDNPYRCTICGKAFSHFGPHRIHLESHNKKLPMFECKFCGKNFTALKLKKHMPVHDTSKKDCKICGKQFQTTQVLKAHVKAHSNPLKCEYCQKSFSNSHHLKEHGRVHTGERPYACHICDKTFKIRNELLVHIYKHPNAEFNCNLCEKGFTSNEELTKHLHRHEVHDYQCEYCGQLLPTAKFYQEHKLTHEDPEKLVANPKSKIKKQAKRYPKKMKPVEKYKCTLCTEEFRLEIHLEKHSRMHDPSRPFPCKICNKAYKLKRHLQQHINKDHLNETHYPCEKCNKVFRDSSTRYQHMIYVHNVSQNLTKCRFCYKKFQSLSNLEKHEKIHDSNTCLICGKEYNTKYLLLYHMYERHPEEDLDSASKKVKSECSF